MAIDPRWPRASDWLAGGHLSDASGVLGVVGLPVGIDAVTPGRCDLAPAAVRKRLTRMSTYDLAADVDLRELIARDCGDAPVAALPLAAMFEPARRAVQAALDGSVAALVLGGHDAITRPACRALGNDIGRLALLTLDAHFDLRDLDGGLSNGNPVRALLADGLSGRNVVQLGLQPFANSRDYAEVARAAGSTFMTVGTWRQRGIVATVTAMLDSLATRADAIYVDCDLDVLDRCHVPGAPGARPGGLAPHELFEALVACGRHRSVRALGLVEVDPTRDVANLSTFAAASGALAFASGVAQRVRAARSELVR